MAVRKNGPRGILRNGRSGQVSRGGRRELAETGIFLLFLFFAFCGVTLHAQATPNGAVDGLTAKFINAGGVRTRYYEMGHGQPLILIHGGGSNSPNSANIWSMNIRSLARHFLVIAPDRPACGMTAGTFSDALNYPKQVVWLYNLIHALHLKGRVNLLGHSAGGGTAFFFALAHPSMVNTLILASAGTETPGHFEKQKLFTELKSCPAKPLFAAEKCRLDLLAVYPQRALGKQFWAANRYMEAWRKHQYKGGRVATPLNFASGLNAEHFFPYLHKGWNQARAGRLGDMPVLIIYGKQDVLDWRAGSPEAQLHGGMALFGIMGAKDPNVQMMVINDAGHFLMRDQPQAFDSDLIHFIDYYNQHASR